MKWVSLGMTAGFTGGLFAVISGAARYLLLEIFALIRG